MALRLLEVFVPADSKEKIVELLRDHAPAEFLGTWQYTAADGVVRTSVLVPAEGVEATMDLMNRHFSTLTGFRMIVVPVEASVPRPDEPENAPEPAASEPPPGTPRISREELYADISETVKLSPVYFGLVVLSAIVAAFGLMRNNVAVIIGAMVIAPLLGPNIALALATTLGDGDLARRAIRINAAGLLTALGIATLIGAALHISPGVPEIATRTRVGLEDIALALASGGAGALSFTTGVPTALVGVMVAVALLPPLVTAGMLFGAGFRMAAGGAALLLLTNIISVNLAAVTMFLVQGIRPHTWWEVNRAARSTRIAIAIWTLLLAVLTGLILVARVR